VLKEKCLSSQQKDGITKFINKFANKDYKFSDTGLCAGIQSGVTVNSAPARICFRVHLRLTRNLFKA